MRKWTHILIHHAAMRDTPKRETDRIRAIHKNERGWADIGYHWLVELVGEEYVAVMGRPETMQGAHCPGMNTKALGVCLVGNFEEAPLPEAQLGAAAALVARLCQKYGIPSENIHRHRDHRQTLCPGKHFDLAKFQERVRAAL